MNRISTATAATIFALTGIGQPTFAQQIFNEDVRIIGGLCAGHDCPAGSTFSTDGIRVTSDSPHISFYDSDDTSALFESYSIYGNTAGFSLVKDGMQTIVKVDPTAGLNSLSLTQDKVGFGTAIPQRSLHVVANSNPALRLEEINTSGLFNHVWEMNAGPTGLRFVDVNIPTSLTPFTIENGAPTNSIHIESGGGNLGLRTDNPTSALHVLRSDGTAKILVEETGGSGAQELFQMKSNGGSYFTLTNTTSGRDWFFTHENNPAGRFIITSSTNPSQGLFYSPNGNMKIGGTLTTGGGTCGGGCDRVFSADYALPSISEHAEAMWQLGYLPNVGPTPENAPINVSDKLGRMLNELEHAHIYIAQQQQEIAALKVERETWETRFSMLETQMSALKNSP